MLHLITNVLSTGAVPVLLRAGPGVPELLGGQIAPEPFFWPLLKELVTDPPPWIVVVSLSSVVSFAMPGFSALTDRIFHPRDPFFAFSWALIRPDSSVQLSIRPEGWDGRSWYYRDSVRTAWPPLTRGSEELRRVLPYMNKHWSGFLLKFCLCL